MPLFKRSKKKDESEKEKDLEAEEEPQDEGEETPADEDEGSPEPPVEDTEDEKMKAAEEEVLGQVDIEEELDETDEEEDEGEPSIDELLEGIEGDAQGQGMADHPKEMDSSLEDLAAEEPNVIKIAKKIVVIGDAAVGKTSLIKRYVKDEFDDRYLNTIGPQDDPLGHSGPGVLRHGQEGLLPRCVGSHRRVRQHPQGDDGAHAQVDREPLRCVRRHTDNPHRQQDRPRVRITVQRG